jgi:hypothetical protein
MHGRIRTGHSRWPALGVAAGSALAVALTGCSGASSVASVGSSPRGAAAAGAQGGNSDPCRTVTAAQASQLVGKTLKKVSDAKWTCTYTARGALVAVTVRRLPDPARSQAYFQRAVSEFSNAQGVVISHPGIGDRSLGGSISLGGYKMSVIVFLKGATYVAIQVNPNPGTAAMKSLAAAALKRV